MAFRFECECKSYGCECECCQPLGWRWRAREWLSSRWYRATSWARFHDGRPGVGLYSKRCQIPDYLCARNQPTLTQLVWFMRGRHFCDAYEGGQHWGHTYHPYPYRTVPRIPGFYASDRELRLDRDPQSRFTAGDEREAQELADLQAALDAARRKAGW